MRLTTGEKLAILAFIVWYFSRSTARERTVKALEDMSQRILPDGYRVNPVTGRVEKLVDGVWRDRP